jgi:hypothetical protein
LVGLTGGMSSSLNTLLQNTDKWLEIAPDLSIELVV